MLGAHNSSLVALAFATRLFYINLLLGKILVYSEDMSDIEEIKRRLNVVDVIGEYVKLQKSGANYRGRCPFHAEKTPSFFVSPEKQIWHCFGGCQKGGDIFRFLMEIEAVEFGQALRVLAGRAGVEIKGIDKKMHDQKSILLRINEMAAMFFAKALEKSEGGKKTMEYLASRKVDNASIERFSLGWAPSSWRSLIEFLEKKGFFRNDIIAAGLAIRSEQGTIYDRFRARLMFPIQTPAGSIVGFTGRVLASDAKEAKYVNTPQTLAYDKSRELYGIYQAKNAIKKADEVIFVEGNLDVILSCQVGIENVVATSGTALTLRHLETISRYTKKLTFCFDADAAGKDAMKRAFEMALQSGFEPHALVLMEEKDPADVVTKRGDTAWQEASRKKLHVMEYLWQSTTSVHDAQTLAGKKSISNELFGLLKFITNQIECGYWIKQFADRLHIRETDMIEEFKKVAAIDRTTNRLYNSTRNSNAPGSIRQDREAQDRENLVAITSLYPELAALVGSAFDFATLQAQLPLSKEELTLKAEIFWPSHMLAKRELDRILESFSLAKKKEELWQMK